MPPKPDTCKKQQFGVNTSVTFSSEVKISKITNIKGENFCYMDDILILPKNSSRQ